METPKIMPFSFAICLLGLDLMLTFVLEPMEREAMLGCFKDRFLQLKMELSRGQKSSSGRHSPGRKWRWTTPGFTGFTDRSAVFSIIKASLPMSSKMIE